MAEQNPVAETTQQQTQAHPAQQQAQQATPNYDELFNMLDAVLDKRGVGIAKSALKDNGIDESEVSDIVKAYREQKQTKANEQATALSDAQKQIADLQKQIADKALDEALSAAALETGVDVKQLPYVTRLADRNGVLGADGKLDPEKVKAAINQVLEDVPALKASSNANKGFQPVGNKTGDDGASPEEGQENKLRSYFGL